MVDTAIVAPSNLFLHSVFSQVDVMLGGRKITSSVTTYPYRAMFETLLNYGTDAKESHLATSLFYTDTPGRMDTIAITGETNEGFIKRKSLCAKSKSFEMYGRLHGDIFFQNRNIINNINMFIRMYVAQITFV